jgi:non-heme chloroperoxidase
VPDGHDDNGRGLVLFLHGSWVHSDCWVPWVALFDDSGYDSVVVRWPHERARATDHRVGPGRTLRPTVADLRRLVYAAVTSMDRAPILLGHGVGGLVAESMLGRAALSAVIAVAPAPSGWRAMLPRTALRERDVVLRRRVPSPGLEAFHHPYATTVDRSEAADLHDRHVIPARASGPLWTIGRRGDPPVPRSPLLLISGGKDLLSPESGVEALVRRNRRRYPDDVTDHRVFPDRAHSLVVDTRWEDVADHCLDWLTLQNL